MNEIQKYRETLKKDKTSNNNKAPLTDDEILKIIDWKHPVTPDITFNKPIMINGNYINWIDCKHWFITKYDIIQFRKLKKTCIKYLDIFGSGAVVSLGYVQLQYPIKEGIIFLDASNFELHL